MKNELFNELLESVRQGGAILRKERAPSRVFAADDIPDAAAVREGYGLSQEKFAALLGISVGTLRNWEQRRRVPEGPARVLLKVAERHPDAVLDTVAGVSGRKSRSERPPQRAPRKRSGKRKAE
jgi:putative transcriptional regulator